MARNKQEKWIFVESEIRVETNFVTGNSNLALRLFVGIFRTRIGNVFAKQNRRQLSDRINSTQFNTTSCKPDCNLGKFVLS